MIRLPVRAVFSLLILLLMLVPFWVTAKARLNNVNRALVRLAFRLGSLVWGIRVSTEGKLSDKRPLLVVSNHFSYIDVFALGAAMKVRFTPKSEIAGWPLIGLFCTITGCLFIDRRPHQTLKNKSMLGDAIKEGDIISLFAEGTTNEGTGLLPFKSSYFSIAENDALMVQPISIVYEKVNDEPVTLANRHLIGWYGDMEFFPHLVTYFQQKSVDVKLVFHGPVSGRDFASRKELAKYCHDVVAGVIPALT